VIARDEKRVRRSPVGAPATPSRDRAAARAAGRSSVARPRTARPGRRPAVWSPPDGSARRPAPRSRGPPGHRRRRPQNLGPRPADRHVYRLRRSCPAMLGGRALGARTASVGSWATTTRTLFARPTASPLPCGNWGDACRPSRLPRTPSLATAESWVTTTRTSCVRLLTSRSSCRRWDSTSRAADSAKTPWSACDGSWATTTPQAVRAAHLLVAVLGREAPLRM
jgi:hypothetical protein